MRQAIRFRGWKYQGNFALDMTRNSIAYHYLSFHSRSHHLTCNRQLRKEAWILLRTPIPTAVITNTELIANIAFNKEQKVITDTSNWFESSNIAARKLEMMNMQQKNLKWTTMWQDYHWSIMPRYWKNNSNAEETKASTSKKLSVQSLITFMMEQKVVSSLITNKQHAMKHFAYLFFKKTVTGLSLNTATY
jgi:hypothetical protein